MYTFLGILAGTCGALLFILMTILISSIRTLARELRQKNIIAMSQPIMTVEYNEDEIIKHLDYIIDEAINVYVILNITAKTIYYINSSMQQEMLNTLQDQIPERISGTLMTKLSYIYNQDYIGTFLGEHIYLKITEFIIVFNTENGGNIEGEK